MTKGVVHVLPKTIKQVLMPCDYKEPYLDSQISTASKSNPDSALQKFETPPS